uniref:Ovule protein n=1 Tax=Heterorhabditis bacteriophora TaxID=37862 RepID=A0A1I7WBB1_HETBA
MITTKSMVAKGESRKQRMKKCLMIFLKLQKRSDLLQLVCYFITINFNVNNQTESTTDKRATLVFVRLINFIVV